MHEKYLGGASDPGEWWVDKPSKADDLGPGVKIYLRVACDEHLPPRILSAYGLREDVRLDRVEAEAQRIIADYLAGRGEWNNEPGRVFGEFIMPSITRWRALAEVTEDFRDYASTHPNRSVRDLLYDVTGSGPMADRLIELVGLDALQKMRDDAGEEAP